MLHAARRDYALYIEAKRRLCEVEPTPKNRVDLALALWEGFQYRAATALLDDTIERWPDYWPARFGRFQYPEQPYVRDADGADAFLAHWREGLADLERRVEAEPARHEEMRDCARLVTNFYTHYLGLPLVEEQRRYGALLERLAGTATSGLPEPKPIAPPGARRRIGFVSGFFRHHTVMKLFGPNQPTLLIAEDDDSGYAANASIAADLLPGDYWVQVRHYNRDSGMGDYSVKVRRA